jgi:hypothetical protein
MGILTMRPAKENTAAQIYVAAYSGLLAMNPLHLQARLERARAYDRLGEWRKAIEDYSAALVLLPLAENGGPTSS